MKNKGHVFRLVVLVSCAAAASAAAQEGATPPHWIWGAPARSGAAAAAGSCYFRKSLVVKASSRLVLDVTADNSFQLYLDGAQVAAGQDWHRFQSVDTQLAAGPHALAAVATNQAPGPAGFLLRGGVLPLGQNVPVHTDASWKATTTVQAGDGWTKPGFDDAGWSRAADLGPLGSGPWGALERSEDAAARFRVPAGFRVTQVAAPAVTGSVVAFTFDEDGNPCVSIERGPIARLVDADKDGRFESRRPIENQVHNCQGLSFLAGSLFAVGNGKDGAGLYRLADADKDGQYESCELIRGARGGMGEHGPHAISLGPDGALYFINGNHAHLKPPVDPNSPVNVAYEGELLPHCNDPSGHAAGKMAPGGEILRSADQGRTWKRIVAGFRNAYDFAFNTEGELFTFDSDMEWDVELPWYRAVRVNLCPIGAEFGWRNGSAKWPAYFFDSLPAVLDVGRGSPTGVTFYQACQFPPEYRDSFLICDWAQGRILAVRLSRSGAAYTGAFSELVSGQPLNCTDIEVGPDGAVYFTTGGRGTQGGLYRVGWDRPRQPPKVTHGGSSIVSPIVCAAIELGSPAASFTRRRIAQIQKANPQSWSQTLETLATSRLPGQDTAARMRALELLCQFGPQPSDLLLAKLASDADERVRARAVALLGARSGAAVVNALRRALADPDPFVRRHACEGLMQQPGPSIPVDALLPLLSDPDRWIRYAARVALEHAGPAAHRQELLALKEPRPLIEGLLALVRAGSIDAALQGELLKREIDLLESQPQADEACDLLRLLALTCTLGPEKSPEPAAARLRPILMGRFSRSADSPFQREAARLLAYLDEPQAVGAILEHQANVSSHTAQIHDAYCLRALTRGWTAQSKQRLWSWYQTASNWEGGYSFRGYLDMMIQSLVSVLDEKERDDYLARGEQFPFPTRVLVRSLDVTSDSRRVAAMASLYGKLAPEARSGSGADLPALIIEKLGRSARPEARAALRAMYERPSDVRDRTAIIRSIAHQPAKEDIELLQRHSRQEAAVGAAAQRQVAYTLPFLVQNVLQSDVMKSATSRRGESVMKRARCLECHKFGAQGTGVGPDLTTVSSRFRPAEILEAIVEPSKVVSDQYKSVDVVTIDGKVYNGMPVVSDGANLVLLLSDGSKATVPKSDIDSRRESRVSVMPTGLIDTLSRQEIADLLTLFTTIPPSAGGAGAR
jgi:putative heme-binding domain-containing protein